MRRRLTVACFTAGAFMVLMLAGCNGCNGPERTVLRGGTVHLPLAHNRVLRYQETEDGKVTRYTIRMIYAGGEKIRVYDLEWKGLEHGFSSLLSSGAKVYYETQQPLTAVVDQSHYRELWIDEDANEGADWNSDDVGINTVFAGYETVTVPAGTYADCYKTVSTVQPVYLDSLKAALERSEMSADVYHDLVQRAGLVVIRWFAAGVGLVKEQIGEPTHVRELVAVERDGMGAVNPPVQTTPSDSGE